MSALVRKFDPSTVKTVLETCEEALALVAEQHGLVLQRKYCTYNADSMPVAFKLVVPQHDEQTGTAIDPAESEFRRLASRYGLEASDFGRVFSTFRGTYRISGVKPKARKYPIQGTDTSTGKRFKFPAEQVRQGLEASP